ncbi:conserved hypothetical protein [Coraliomargarita akajimensis DSM 45221]|uniref:Uncharacterized protein n=1 Tax=Coraliomargarita akajimensis (strain DSM 45221 / IAM 15411 / JCM 23193 / KCTC 12865 / 04OKA010-24) TaxID=583355 RepID=D5EQD2_CORAD|nr:conserved hypothetical protein [Coraliomargarita akajimensis DSM 45221]
MSRLHRRLVDGLRQSLIAPFLADDTPQSLQPILGDTWDILDRCGNSSGLRDNFTGNLFGDHCWPQINQSSTEGTARSLVFSLLGYPAVLLLRGNARYLFDLLVPSRI